MAYGIIFKIMFKFRQNLSVVFDEAVVIKRLEFFICFIYRFERRGFMASFDSLLFLILFLYLEVSFFDFIIALVEGRSSIDNSSLSSVFFSGMGTQ